MADTSVERAFAIFETFERERRPLSMTELAEACRMPASTCHALAHTLIKRAYLYQTSQRKDLYPTRRLYDVGAVILAHDPVLQRLGPAMEALRVTTRETVILGKRQKQGVVYLEVLEGPEVIRYSAKPGDAKPLHSTCIGKALLSTLAPEALRALLAELEMTRITPATLTDAERLVADIEQGRRRGWFATRGENVPDVSAYAAPLAINNELFGLAVAGPSHRMDAREPDICAALLATRDALLREGVAGSC